MDGVMRKIKLSLKHADRFVMQRILPGDAGIGRIYRWDDERKIAILCGTISSWHCRDIREGGGKVSLLSHKEDGYYVRIFGNYEQYQAHQTRQWLKELSAKLRDVV
jgi:hypothetical protein